MDDIFWDEIDRDSLEGGLTESVHIRLAKAEQAIRELTAERDRLRGELEEQHRCLSALLALAEERVNRLRWAMRESIINAGGVAASNVSDDFLCLLPTEVGALKYAQRKAEKERTAATARAEAAETQARIDRKLAETLESRALADAVWITELEAVVAEERRLRQDADSKLMGHDDRLNAVAYELSALRAKYEEERTRFIHVLYATWANSTDDEFQDWIETQRDAARKVKQ